jgi:hypothetical protein
VVNPRGWAAWYQRGRENPRSLPLRLEAVFFREHPQLQRYAEVTLAATIRNAATLVLGEACVEPIIARAVGALQRAALADAGAWAAILGEARRVAEQDARAFLRQVYHLRIPACLELLAAPASAPEVTRVAAQLTLEHALAEGVGEGGACCC